MQHGYKNHQTPKSLKILLVCFFVFFSAPGYAGYYGGHHYGYGHGHYGYHHYYPHYRYHRGYRGHYGVHGHFSGDAAYVVLGILGAAVLTHIITKNSYNDKRYRKTYSYNKPRTYTPPTRPKQTTSYKKTVKKSNYYYKRNEGWDWLEKGNAGYALDIFAIQSQQNLNSGIPKIGFAIAAASNGETDRAIRAMRKAVRVDAAALNKININSIKPTVEKLTEGYTSAAHNDSDNAFMIAALSYLQKDYQTANNVINNNDQSKSANNLRELLKRIQ